MDNWRLVADSTCDLNPETAEFDGIAFGTVPMKVIVGDKTFIDTPETDVNEMLSEMKAFSGASSSSCPSPEAFAEQFRKAENSFAVTITSGLSGTYNCAVQAKNMVLDESPEKKIHVVDSLSTAGSIVLILRRLAKLINEGLPFEEIVRRIEEYRDGMRIFFTLAAFGNLVKNGRMSKTSGVLASALNIRAIGVNSDKGTIEIIDKPRGEKRAIEHMVELMLRYKPISRETPIVITHCNNPEGAKALCEKLKSSFGLLDEDITVLKCACLTAFYADEQGLLLCF